MKLFIARHGQASYEAASDFERPLTQRGVDQTKALVDAHRSTLKQVSHIWCSTLTRAKQTASIFENELNLKPEVKPFLSPDEDVAKVLRELSKANLDGLLVVSHQPLVGELVSVLVEANVYQAHPFTTSEVVVLDMEMIEAGMASLSADLIPS